MAPGRSRALVVGPAVLAALLLGIGYLSRRVLDWRRLAGGLELGRSAVDQAVLDPLATACAAVHAVRAVTATAAAVKGQVPRGFVVLKAGSSVDPDALGAELVQLVRDRIGPVAALRRVDVVTALPKTRSGKILRKTMRGIAEGSDEPAPSTIDDPSAVEAMRPILRGGG